MAEDLQETLIDHILDNHPDLLENALQGLDVNISIEGDESGPERTTLLNIAAANNRPEIVEMLIRMNCDIDAQDSDGVTALMIACEYGHLHLIQRFLGAGCDINHKDFNGHTPLFSAVRSGNADVIRAVLVAKGINPDEVNQDENSRAEMNRLNNRGYSLLMCAAMSYYFTPEIVHMLVSAGCDANQVSGDKTVLLQVLTYIIREQEQVLQVLIDRGADVCVANEQGKTPLMEAAASRMPSIVRTLLDAGSDVHMQDAEGRTALHHATKFHDPNIDIIRMLIEDDSNVNSRDKNNQTPLMYSLNRDFLSMHPVNKDVYSLLLDAGADTKAVDNNGFTVLMHAMSGKCTTVDTVRLLLESGCADTINMKNNDGETALRRAVHYRRLDFVRVLLGVKGIKIDMNACRAVDLEPDLSDLLRDLSFSFFDQDLDQNLDLDQNRRTITSKPNECLREIAATVIQRAWRECYYNPSYLVCQRRLMEEGEELGRVVQRLRKEEDDDNGDDSNSGGGDIDGSE